MCAGPEIFSGLQMLGTAVGAISGVKTLLSGAPSQPAAVVREAPVQQQENTDTQAAQEAEAQKLAARQRARANSLLSRAGGAGDLSTADTTSGRAMAKVNLGD